MSIGRREHLHDVDGLSTGRRGHLHGVDGLSTGRQMDVASAPSRSSVKSLILGRNRPQRPTAVGKTST